MLMRTDSFRELDRLTRQVFEGKAAPSALPMDAYRSGDTFVVRFDLPGVDPESIDLDIERNVLTVSAERRSDFPEDAQVITAERMTGGFSRQLFLSDALDAEHVAANYEAGVLTLRIPVAEQAKPRKIQISGGDQPRQIHA